MPSKMRAPPGDIPATLARPSDLRQTRERGPSLSGSTPRGLPHSFLEVGKKKKITFFRTHGTRGRKDRTKMVAVWSQNHFWTPSLLGHRLEPGPGTERGTPQVLDKH